MPTLAVSQQNVHVSHIGLQKILRTIPGQEPPRAKTVSEAGNVGDRMDVAGIAWLSRDSFVPMLFKRSKPLHGKMTREGVVCGIADVLVATLRHVRASTLVH